MQPSTRIGWRRPTLPSQSTSVPGRSIFVGITMGLVAIYGMFGLLLYDAREDVRRDVTTATGNVAAVVAQDIDRNLELLDLSLQDVVESWQTASVRNLDPTLRQMILFDRLAKADDFGSMRLLDANGDVLADSNAVTPQADNYADRDYFRVHAANDHVGLYVSAPFRSKTGGDWRIGLSRRLPSGDGTFKGVAVGTFRLSYLSKLYHRMHLATGDSLSLFNGDGLLVMREPYLDEAIGRDFRHSEIFEQVGAVESGSVEGTASLDGIRRIYSFHRVGERPLTQFVAVSIDHAFAAWRRKAMMIGAVLTLLCCGVLVLLSRLKAELVRRVAAEAALTTLASIDSLTGLANRRRFDQVLDEEWRRAIRERSVLALLMIDADAFKAYNDTYGHMSGDRLLTKLGDCIAAQVRRPADLAARYGGEEFAILLPNTDAIGAWSVAEAIRLAVLELGQEHIKAPSGLASVSVGIAEMRPQTDQSSDALLARANAALYRSKLEGRNRTAFFDAVGSNLSAA